MSQLDQIMAMLDNENSEQKPMGDLQKAAMAESLLEHAATLTHSHSFKPGDLVEWKPGLRNKKTDYGVPLVVTRVLPEPVYSSGEEGGSAGSPYFNEPLDIVLGEYSKSSGDFLEYHYDSRRLQPYTGPRSVDALN